MPKTPLQIDRVQLKGVVMTPEDGWFVFHPDEPPMLALQFEIACSNPSTGLLLPPFPASLVLLKAEIEEAVHNPILMANTVLKPKFAEFRKAILCIATENQGDKP